MLTNLQSNLKCFLLTLSLVVIAMAYLGNARAAEPMIQEFVVPDEISSPHSITIDPSGNVWFAEKVGKSLSMFDPEEKAFSGGLGPQREDLVQRP